jgi:hypothetical protein
MPNSFNPLVNALLDDGRANVKESLKGNSRLAGAVPEGSQPL